MASVIYIPTFLPAYEQRFANGEDKDAINRELLLKDWITTDLRNEIITLYPSAAEKDPVTGKRDHAAFIAKAKMMFPVGRMFASFKQIDQVAKLFLDAWAISKVNGQSKIYCAHGLSRGKTKQLHSTVSMRRNCSQTEKEKCQCPFEIRYSPQGRVKKKTPSTKPVVFLTVKVTACVYEHKCSMDTTSHRLAFQSNGQNTPDLTRIHHIIRMLREKPSIPNHVLRPEIAHAIPHYRGMDAAFMRNFRSRVLTHCLKHTDVEVTHADVASFTSQQVIAAHEVIDLDQPITHQNYTTMLRRCMQEGSSTWVALKFLDELKVTLPGFDYRMKRTIDGYPEGIVWMTPEMKKNICRYGQVLFLDGQKRQYNRMNWPYIGPALKDNEMKVCLGAESIVVEESLKTYKWVLESMCDMEPRFDLSNIKIIFGDQLITHGLLVSLGIRDTCLLRPDFYHLTNEVWPKSENFGQVLYPRIKNFMETMLKSTTESEYTNAFEAALAVVRYEPSKRSYLESIYNDHEYYGGFFLLHTMGNLGLLGSCPAEQNHSSIVAHLGDGASWEIAQHIQHLMNRQKELTKQRTEKENSQFCSTLHYKSSKRGQERKDEEAAKKTLSNYAFQKLFMRKSFQGARKLRHKFDVEGNCFVWPAKLGVKDIYGLEHSRDNFESEEHINPELVISGNGLYRIPIGERCPCTDRISFMFQCSHEYHRDGEFKKELYNGKQWFTRRVYDEWTLNSINESHLLHGEDSERNEDDMSSNDEVIVPPPQGDVEEEVDMEQSNEYGGPPDDSDEEIDDPMGADGRQNYSTVKRQCDELCRAIANDQTQLQSVFATVTEMIERLRRQQSISVYFLEDTAMNNNALSQNVQPLEGGALLGQSRALSVASRMKRKRSATEVYRSRGRNVQTNYAEVGTETIFVASDENHLPAPRTNSRACSMCRLTGHFIRNCPFLIGYGSPPLEKNNMACRHQLQAKLTGVGTVSTSIKTVELEVFNTLPTDIDALIIFGRFFIDHTLRDPEFTGNYCVECTVLHKGGQENSDYSNVLFAVSCVSTFVVRSKTNIVISLLKDLCGGNILSQVTGNIPGNLCQPTTAALEVHPTMNSQVFTQYDYNPNQQQEQGVFSQMGYATDAPYL
jgi:hypothetical protein